MVYGQQRRRHWATVLEVAAGAAHQFRVAVLAMLTVEVLLLVRGVPVVWIRTANSGFGGWLLL